jgi:hypothetical protein
MGFFGPQNPGIGGLEEVTDAEALFLQNLAALSYAQGDMLYHNGTNLTRLAKGTASQQLRMNAGATAPEWFTAGGGSGDVIKVGTPVNNQIGVWTGDGTLEGDANLTWDGTSFNIATAKNFQIAGSTILADSAGTTTLSNIDAIDATTESTIEAAIDTLANLTSIQGRTITLADAGADAFLAWDDSASAYQNISAADAFTILGITSSATELNVLDGIPATLTATELGYVDGVTSAIQTQLDAKLALAGGTMTGNITLAENSSIALDPAGSADGKWSGITITATSGYAQAFGDVVYLDPTDSRWEAADANAAAGADGDARGILAMVVVTGTDGNSCTLLLNGIIRADANFPALTVGAPVYVAETAGDIVVAQPTTTDAVIRMVGAALTADEIYFNPDFHYTTHT